MTKTLVFNAIGLSLAGVLLYGTLAGPRGLPRIACGLAFISLAASVLVARRLGRKALERTCRVLEYTMTGSLVAFVCLTQALGGGALNGRVTDGSYYLARGGDETQVSGRTYYLLAGFETYLLAIVAAGMIFGIRSRSSGEARG